MRPALTTTVILLVVVSASGLALGATVPADATELSDASELAPGERIAALVAGQDAAIAGDLDDRAYGLAIAEAATPEDRGIAVANQVADLEDRLADIETRSADLEAARDDGEIGHGEYMAESARLEAERTTVERLADRSEGAAADLPADVRADQGIDHERIDSVRTDARDLRGPEAADIAREIAGPPDDHPSNMTPDRDSPTDD